METMLACLTLVALAGMSLGLFSAIINGIKKKTAKTSLKITGISIIVLMIAVFTYPKTLDKPSDVYNNQTTAGIDNISVPEKTDDYTSNEIEDKPEELENEHSDSKQEKGHSEEEKYIGDELWLEDATDFSEGRAWVQFRAIDREKGSAEANREVMNAGLGNAFGLACYMVENYELLGKNQAALINTQGKILWESEPTRKNTVLKEKSEFRDGLAYCVFEGDGKRIYNIIDSDGNVTFTRDAAEDYIILGHGGGMFLVAAYTADFSHDGWKFGAIDKNGDIVVPFQEYEFSLVIEMKPVAAPSGNAPAPDYDYEEYLEYQEQIKAYEKYIYYSCFSDKLLFALHYDRKCEYLGNRIFQLSSDGWKILLNLETQNIIYSYNTYDHSGGMLESFISDFENGSATVVYKDNDGQSICSLEMDGKFIKIASNDWIRYSLRSDMEFGDGLVFASDNGVNTEITGGVLLENLTTGAYYNTAGERVIDFPEYDDKNLCYCGTPFQNGHAVMFIEGADGYLYTTVINKKGKRMFEPKAGFMSAYMSADGKYLTAVRNRFLTVFDIKGKELISVKSTSIDPEYGYENNANNGMVKVCSKADSLRYFYVNIKNGKVIGMYGDTKDSVKVY